jgi:uncharacterized SAM-binding protein YcdF (DUF218 family)
LFFFLSKILSYILNPLAWIFILFFAAFIVRKQPKKRRLFLSTLVIMIMFTNPFLGDEIIRVWEKPMKMVTNSQQYDAGVILGGDIVTYDKDSDRVIFRSGADRLLQAIDLYKSGIIKKIVISGGSGHLIYRDRTEASFIKKYLTGIGINNDDIIVENMSKNTVENARYTAKLLETNRITDTVLLITSSIHMRRAAACFRKQGIGVEEFPTSKITGKRITDFHHLVVPSVATLKNWDLLIHELLGFCVYKILGYC